MNAKSSCYTNVTRYLKEMSNNNGNLIVHKPNKHTQKLVKIMEIYRNLNYILSYILYRLYFKNQKNYFLNPIQ